MKNKIFYILIGSLLIITFFLIYEHMVHLYGLVPYAFFIIFVGLHFFMHIGHGRHSGDKKEGHFHE